MLLQHIVMTEKKNARESSNPYLPEISVLLDLQGIMKFLSLQLQRNDSVTIEAEPRLKKTFIALQNLHSGQEPKCLNLQGFELTGTNKGVELNRAIQRVKQARK